jgi:hypothetical protein
LVPEQLKQVESHYLHKLSLASKYSPDKQFVFIQLLFYYNYKSLLQVRQFVLELPSHVAQDAWQASHFLV